MKEKMMIKIQKNSLSVLKLLPIFILFASLTSFSDKALAGDFAKTCGRIRLSGSTLSATCRTRRGGNRGSRINLNDFVTNSNGYLRFSNNEGAFSRTCRNIRLSRSRRTLLASCRTFSGNLRNTSLNLNARITNRNGSLDFE